MAIAIHHNCPFGSQYQKYWDKRYEFFSLFDQGIQLDLEGLFSVKPEQSALEIGHSLQGETVVDAFGGVGGSTIGLARAGHRVIYIEVDENRCAMAKNNAEVYGVSDKVTFINGDFSQVIETLHGFDAIYYDPPWGGPDYATKETFRLHDFNPSGDLLIRTALERHAYMGMTVPKNFTYEDVADLDYKKQDYRNSDKLVYSTCFVDFRKPEIIPVPRS